LAGLIVLPSLVSSGKYGHPLKPSDVTEYPELGPGGRYNANDRIPFPPFSTGVADQGRRALKGDGTPLVRRLYAWATVQSPGIPRSDIILDVVLGLIALGSFFLLKREETARRLFAFL